MDPTVRPPRDARHGHWLRTVAALRRYDLRAAASHTSLVIAQGLPDYRLDLSTVHLTRSSPGVSHRGGEVRIHRPIGVDLTGRDRVPTAIGVVQAGLEGVPGLRRAGRVSRHRAGARHAPRGRRSHRVAR